MNQVLFTALNVKSDMPIHHTSSTYLWTIIVVEIIAHPVGSLNLFQLQPSSLLPHTLQNCVTNYPLMKNYIIQSSLKAHAFVLRNEQRS